MTNQDVIDQALGELGVLEKGESADATDAADALAALNQMMAAFSIQMDMHFPPQDTLGDTCPIPTWAEEGVVSMLARRCAPLFKMPLTPELADKAMRGENMIGTTLINLKLKRADMTHLGGGLGRWDITTDLIQ